MKIISNGNRFEIFPNNISMYEKLPPKYYSVNFDPQGGGLYLSLHPDLELTEDKIYGVSQSKVDKVFRTFDKYERNLGVILSGDKGIGKSLTAKMMCMKGISLGYPVILVNRAYEGISDFIGNMDQELIVLFDEFDKTYTEMKESIYTSKNTDTSKQTSLLGLFDGIYPGKKLFIITCNDLFNLNDYLLNRTGRFHYHFRFDYPSDDDIRSYMKDKIDPEYYGEIEEVIQFSKRVDLNYDSLRSIAFELNMGESFKEAIQDLNIVNIDEVEYDVELHLKNGEVINQQRMRLDLFSDNTFNHFCDSYGPNGEISYYIDFIPATARYDKTRYLYVIDASKLSVRVTMDEHGEEANEAFNRCKVDFISVKRSKKKGYLYIL